MQTRIIKSSIASLAITFIVSFVSGDIMKKEAK